MKHAKLLDCTLRDGAYLIDKNFGQTTIQGIITGLIEAEIDFIEVGFFQDEGFEEGKTVYKNSADAKRVLPVDKNKSQFTVLADCSRYSIQNLDEHDENSIDAIRECFFKEEWERAISNCKVIKEKGYKLFIQPVDILGYTDIELIELIEKTNEVEPYCFSIVDTFGSMFPDDLRRIFELVHHNLIKTSMIGFHSHNNLQMSAALSQEFLRMTYGKRNVVVDSTISGMGRGAGNTPTEIIVYYMVSQLGYDYNMDAILDIIDNYMDNIRSRCTWGYTTPYFIAGCYNAHVNNISYLTRKNSIGSKDIRYILNKIGPIPRKRYDYDLLEQTYLEYINSDIDDRKVMNTLAGIMNHKNILLVFPGKTADENREVIQQYTRDKNAVVITVNFMDTEIKTDMIYISNRKRYSYWSNYKGFLDFPKILTSNLISEAEKDQHAMFVSFPKLIKCGWEHLDSSGLMLLRLLDQFEINNIAIAGYDGYNPNAASASNYVSKYLELSNVKENPVELNQEISEMLEDYKATRIRITPIEFITPSRFSHIFKIINNKKTPT